MPLKRRIGLKESVVLRHAVCVEFHLNDAEARIDVVE